LPRSEQLRGVLATVGQIVCQPAFWFLAYIVCQAKVEYRLILPDDPKARFIIAANHQSRLDAFVITGILKPHFWRRLLPYRYITANQFLYGWATMWVCWPLGGFPAYPTTHEKWGLARAKQVLAAGQTVCIFPEGQRSIPQEILPKRGVAVLANTPHTYVIPIHLQWQRRRRHVELVVGQAYNASGRSAVEIMDTIYRLSKTQ
jgi:1-acyl-sn-glycerol-3-phosphate acyltransferase